MVRLAKHRKNRKGGGPPVYLNLNTNVGTPTEFIGTTSQQQTLANAMRQIRRSHGVQANTPTSIAAELSQRHEPVVGTDEKKPGFFNRLFGRTRKNTGEKKPGFFNRLLGRTQKKNTEGEKKPGFFNRLFGRTKKVQPQPQALAIRPPPSPPQLAPAPAPPTPPAISRPSTPVIGPNAYTRPKTITIPRRFNLETDYAIHMPSNEFEKIQMEEYHRCVLRVMWYLKQRLAGHTHMELLPHLDIPGSMVITKEEIEQLKQQLLPYIKLLNENKYEEADELKTKMFGPNIDAEISAWEKGERIDPTEEIKIIKQFKNDATNAEEKEMQKQLQELKKKQKNIEDQHCINGRCILYKYTPQQVTAHGNVGNGLKRFVERNFDFDFIRSRTNIWRGALCNPAIGDDCYSALTFDKLLDAYENGLLDPYNPELQILCLDDPQNVIPKGFGYQYYYMLLSTKPVLNAFLDKQVNYISPKLALRLQVEAPELLQEAFGTAIRWEKLSKPVALRMFTVQYLAALQLVFQTNDPQIVKKVFETYPEPGLGLLLGATTEDNEKASEYFVNIQTLEGVPPIRLQDYLLQLKKIKNIQVRQTIQPYTVPQNLVQNWARTKKVRTANNYKRNEARKAIGMAKLGNSSIIPYNQRFLAPPSYNMTKRAKQNAKTKANLQRRLNAGFGPASAPVGVKPSAYETIPNW
jgi:hypothetical protein